MTLLQRKGIRNMRTKFLSIIAVALLLAACETTPKAVDSTAGSAGQQPGITAGAGSGAAGAGATAGRPRPGSQEELNATVGDRVFFETDKFDLRADARSTVDRWAAWLRQYPNLRITLEGHADERGTREYNLALGDRRATATRNYLISLGVDPTRVGTISYGKERPSMPGSSEESWAQNRRSVLIVN
jgi:peptidoglycan-associated lipoprotein